MKLLGYKYIRRKSLANKWLDEVSVEFEKTYKVMKAEMSDGVIRYQMKIVGKGFITISDFLYEQFFKEVENETISN